MAENTPHSKTNTAPLRRRLAVSGRVEFIIVVLVVLNELRGGFLVATVGWPILKRLWTEL